MYDQFQKYKYCKNNDELVELKWIVDDTLDVWNKKYFVEVNEEGMMIVCQ